MVETVVVENGDCDCRACQAKRRRAATNPLPRLAEDAEVRRVKDQAIDPDEIIR